MGNQKENNMLKILEGRLVEDAVAFFEDRVIELRSTIPDPVLSEVFGGAIAWKLKHVYNADWGKYPLNDVCISLIRGEL